MSGGQTFIFWDIFSFQGLSAVLSTSWRDVKQICSTNPGSYFRNYYLSLLITIVSCFDLDVSRLSSNWAHKKTHEQKALVLVQLWWSIFNFAAAWGSSFRAIHHIFEKKKAQEEEERGGGGVTDVGGGLLTALTAVRDGGLSEQEMTWPPLWETGPPRQQPPQLWASWVATSAHRGRRSNSSAAGTIKSVGPDGKKMWSLVVAVSLLHNKTEHVTLDLWRDCEY